MNWTGTLQINPEPAWTFALLPRSDNTAFRAKSRIPAESVGATGGLWERVAPLLPAKAGDLGRTVSDNRLFQEAVLWMVCTGAPWRDLPEMVGNWNTAFRCFRPWGRTSAFEHVFRALSGDPDFKYALIDGTIIRIHQRRMGAKGGRVVSRSDAPAAA